MDRGGGERGSRNGHFVTAEHVVSTEQGDATVLLDVRAGTYFTLNGVGGRIWGLLSEGSSVAAVAERLAAEYSVSAEQARGDVEAFVESLQESHLIRSVRADRRE